MDNSTIKHQEVLDICDQALSELKNIQNTIQLSFAFFDDCFEVIVPYEEFQRTYYVLDRYKKCTQEISEQIRIFMSFLDENRTNYCNSGEIRPKAKRLLSVIKRRKILDETNQNYTDVENALAIGCNRVSFWCKEKGLMENPAFQYKEGEMWDICRSAADALIKLESVLAEYICQSNHLKKMKINLID